MSSKINKPQLAWCGTLSVLLLLLMVLPCGTWGQVLSPDLIQQFEIKDQRLRSGLVEIDGSVQNQLFHIKHLDDLARSGEQVLSSQPTNLSKGGLHMLESFTLPKEETLHLTEDLTLWSQGDVIIDGDILADALRSDQLHAQDVVIRSLSRIVIRGKISLQDGNDGDIHRDQLYQSYTNLANRSLFNHYASITTLAIPLFAQSGFDGGNGGSIYLIAPEIVFYGAVRPGNGGNAYLGGKGGHGGNIIQLFEFYNRPSNFGGFRAGDGGGDYGHDVVGAGGDGGHAIALALGTDGTDMSGAGNQIGGNGGNGTSNATTQTNSDGGNGGDGISTSFDGINGNGQGGAGGNGGSRSTVINGLAAGGNGGNGGTGTGANGTEDCVEAGGAGGQGTGGNGGNGGNGQRGGGATASIAGGTGGTGGSGIGGPGGNSPSATIGGAGGAGLGGDGGKGGNSGDPNGDGGNGGNGGDGIGGNGGMPNGTGAGGTGGAAGNGVNGRGTGANGSAGTPGSSTPGANGSAADDCLNSPVTLSTFIGKVEDNKIHLSWTTSSEQNNDRFDIERRTDSEGWSLIGTRKGKGTTNEAQSYNFIDQPSNEGDYYYRLRQFDFDGTNDYSEVIALQVGESLNSSIKVFPNPFYETLNISGLDDKETYQVSIQNGLGQTVRSIFLKEGQNSINLAALPSGQYFINIRDERGRVTSQKVVK